MTVKEWLAEYCKNAGFTDTASRAPLPCEGEVVVRKGGARSLKAGGAWIYDNEIDRVGPAEAGTGTASADETGCTGVCGGGIVRVKDFDGYVLDRKSVV